MILSNDKLVALEVFAKWDMSKPFILGGYAGTGKTTLIKHMLQPGDIVAAFTNKAVSVLQSKGIPALTIHNLLYQKVCDEPLTFIKKPSLIANRIFIDESSMLGASIRADLESYKVPIVYVGDPFQLPPVNDGDSIITNPTFCLTDINRQAADSPIISLANKIRTTGKWPHTVDRYEVDYSKYDIVICYKNITRFNLNRKIRKDDGPAKPGDVVSLMKTCYHTGIAGGEIGTITSMERPYRFMVMFDQGSRRFNNAKFIKANQSPYAKELTGKQVFDFGHVITCHKAQGSQFDKVLVIDEGCDPRWMYTAVTRAISHVDIAG